MSGHSKWATIKRSKGAADAKRGVIFTKLSKNVSLAAKNGKDPDMNSALRSAIDAAKAANMPKDNIERAILRGAGELPGQNIEEITYEGYGPDGVALLIRCATDNTNRTSTFIKTALKKQGGKLGGPGTVGYLFTQRGVLRSDNTNEDMQLQAMDAGAEDIVEEDDGLTLYTAVSDLEAVKNALGEAVNYSDIEWVPSVRVAIENNDTRGKMEKLVEVLEENEDVVELQHNAEL